MLIFTFPYLDAILLLFFSPFPLFIPTKVRIDQGKTYRRKLSKMGTVNYKMDFLKTDPFVFPPPFLEGGVKRKPFDFAYASTIPAHLRPSSGQEPGIMEFSVKIRRLLSLFRSVALLKLPRADRSPAKPLGSPSTLKMVPNFLPMNVFSLFISSECSFSREYSPQSNKRSPKSFWGPKILLKKAKKAFFGPKN